jgi:hypothetical protein
VKWAERKFLKVLGRAHCLTFRERRSCRRLALLYGLDGRGGPETSPSMVFFRPSFWKVFLRDARTDPGSPVPADEIERLRERLFAEVSPVET